MSSSNRLALAAAATLLAGAALAQEKTLPPQPGIGFPRQSLGIGRPGLK